MGKVIKYNVVAYKNRELRNNILLMATSGVMAIKLWEYFNPMRRWLEVKEDMELRGYVIGSEIGEKIEGGGKRYFAVVNKAYEDEHDVLLFGNNKGKAIRLWEYFNPTITWLEAQKKGWIVKGYDIKL